jgi:kynurenine formamidase
MTHLRAPVLVLFAAALVNCAAPPAPAPAPGPAAPFPNGTIVDLSHAYGEDTVFWPTADKFKLDVISAGMTPAGFYYAANKFTTAEHGGTHLDAPVHFAAGRRAVDEIPLDHLIGPAVVVDVTAASAQNADHLVTVADFEAFERSHGRIPDGAILLVRTGFSSRWPDAARYLGTAERGAAAVPMLHFPGIDPAAATWLVANRAIHAVGIDTASIDYGQSTTYESHRILYDANIPGLENLNALDTLPPTGAFIVALPMKIRGGSGAPLRAIAIVP